MSLRLIFRLQLKIICLVLLRLNVPVNNFSVMLGRSHGFLGITSTFRGVNVSLLKDTTRRSLAPVSEALPLGHRAPPKLICVWWASLIISYMTVHVP